MPGLSPTFLDNWSTGISKKMYCLSVNVELSDNKHVTQAITKDPETMHGVPVFRGTRVPVQTLFEYLEGGDTLEDFLEGFPTVSRSVALDVLEQAKQLLLASV